MVYSFNELRIRRLEFLKELNELETSVAELIASLREPVEAEVGERASSATGSPSCGANTPTCWWS